MYVNKVYLLRNNIILITMSRKYYSSDGTSLKQSEYYFFYIIHFENKSQLVITQPTYVSTIKPTHLDSSRMVLCWRIPVPLWLQLKNLLLPLTLLCWHDFDCAPLTTFSTTRFMSTDSGQPIDLSATNVMRPNLIYTTDIAPYSTLT